MTAIPLIGDLSDAFRQLLTLILTIVVLAISIYLFWTLVITFTKLIVSVIFSPFAFLWGALPGQEDTTTRWFRGFLVNVLTFPLIYFLFNLALYFAELSTWTHIALTQELGWGGVISVASINVGGFVAMGLLITATKVPKMLEDAFAVTTSGAVAGAGVDVSRIAQRIPIIGNALR